MATQTSEKRASTVLPAAYRFMLMNVEPFLAFAGALTVIFRPQVYVAGFTRETVLELDDRTLFIYTELAGGWLFVAFVEAVVLRIVDDLRVWRLLALGILVSDVAYCHSCAEALGGWNEWIILSNWTIQEWIVTITTWPFVLTRLAIVLGVGLRSHSNLKNE